VSQMGLPRQEDEPGAERSLSRCGPIESDHEEEEELEERLPLASSLARLAPSHPLIATLLIDPLLVRVARLERALLNSPPAQTLLRLGLATERVVVAVVVTLGALAVVRWRAQWRAMVYTLALGDVVRRTVALLAELSPAAAAKKGAQQRRRPEDGVHASEPESDEEAQHLLSFWLLVALLSFAESFRTRPRHPLAETFAANSRGSNSLSARAAKFLHALRHSYLQFIRRYILPTLLRTRWAAQRFVTTYPSFDPAPVLAKLPALPNNYYLRLPFRSANPSRPRASFPQPRAHPSDRPPRGPGPIPLAWSWFVSSSAVLNGTNTNTGAEIRWSLFKLVLLLLGQRTDALGARNVLWTWGLEPLVAVSAKLRSSSHSGRNSEEREQKGSGDGAQLGKEQRRRRRVLNQSLREPTSLASTEAVVEDYARSSVDESSLEYDSRDLYGYTLANAPPVSPYAWTPRLARVNPPPLPHPAVTVPLRGGADESAAATGQSSSISTPRRPRSRNSHSPTPSRSQARQTTSSTVPTNSFQLLQSPPPASHSALRSSPASITTTNGGAGGTPVGVTYRFASAHHPLLLGPRSATGSAASSSSIATTSHQNSHSHSQPQPLTASALALVGRAGSVRTNGRPSSFVAAAAAAAEEEDDDGEDPEADEDDDDDEGLMTPGEEEAEEGQRKWAGIAA
jgi:hypothetical protein